MNNIQRFFLVGLILLIAQFTTAQHYIAGTIKDSKNNEPLIGANIYLEGTTLGTASDKEGKYEITGVPSGTYILRASYHGYKTEEHRLEIYQNKSSTHFRMTENSIDLNAIVVTGTRTEKQISKSPVLTQIIDKKAIQRQGITYLPQALANNNASFEGLVDIEVKSFSFDGLNAQYTIVLVDGERLAGETKGAADLSRINPSSVERIEIIKGAASTLYGSNAIGGVVNIITRDISQPLEVKAGVQTTLFTDPSTSKNRSEEYAYANLSLSTGKLSSFTDAKVNNYAPYDINNGDGIQGFLTQEDEKNYNVSQKLVFRLNNRWSFSGNASYYNLERNYQRQDDYPDKKSTDFTYGLKTTFYPFEKGKLEFSWHSDQNKIYDIHNLGTEKSDSLDYNNLYQNARLLGRFEVADFNDITLGIEYIREKQSSLQNNFEDQSLENFVVYLQDEISITRDFKIIAGARTEFHSNYDTQFTPQLSAMFSSGKLTFRGSFGQGFRAPSIKELYTKEFDIPAFGLPFSLYLDGNPDLKPETSNYYSASVQYSDEKLNVSVNISRNEVDELIINTDSVSQIMDESIPPRLVGLNYVYKNVEEAEINSLNILARYQVFNGLAFSASYSYTDAKNISQNDVLPNVRKHNARANLDFSHSFKKYTVSTNLNASYFGTKQVTDIYSQEQNPALVGLSDFMLLRLMTTHTFKKHYTVKLGVNNILDKTDDQPEYLT